MQLFKKKLANNEMEQNGYFTLIPLYPAVPLVLFNHFNFIILPWFDWVIDDSAFKLKHTKKTFSEPVAKTAKLLHTNLRK